MWSEKDLTPTQRALLDRQILDLSGTVDSDMYFYTHVAIRHFLAMGSPDIEVLISSEGGSGVDGFNIYDLFRTYAGKTTAKVMGGAQSAAAIFLQGCTVRTCASHGLILVHHPRYSETMTIDDLKNREKIDAMIADGDAGTEAMYRIFLKRTKMKRPQLRKLCLEDRNVSAEEALKLGLIDEIF